MPTINDQQIGPTGFGLMGLTWRATPPPKEQAFAAMRAALANGMNFWNGGDLYGNPEYNSMTLLSEYFAKYPEDADKVVLSMKAGVNPDQSPAGVRKTLDNMLGQLKGTKKVDVFEFARRNQAASMEEAFRTVKEEYIDTGKVGGISLSEVRLDTLKEAVKHVKVVAVEVEVSLFSTDVLTNGIAATCAEHNIPIVAYSPIGRGLLTGQIRSIDDIPEDSMLRHYPRFQPDTFPINIELVGQVEAIARRKGCTPAQLAISWVRSLSRRPGMPTFIPIPGATTAERVEENSKHFDITDDEMAEIDRILAKFPVAGERYPEQIPSNT
ncbi:aldo/keto reductase [Microdochium trichocladiopsis]|uniref:Aldo/keto reductase n=1 Tax=Microdochium trichocladiopsis TaxID=1682393 RepID=A0A9P9BUX3_9PEZI|nr:aldo/keto reductase [Microdochium trichocladiopsis]KAH7039688.1 aldo/keto reductase [Microdochium trichocladiopsis]